MCQFNSKEVTKIDPKTGKKVYTTQTGEKIRDCGKKDCLTSDQYGKKWWVFDSQVACVFGL